MTIRHQGRITISSSLLKEALIGAVPKLRKNVRYKSFPISIRFDESSRHLEIDEARYAERGYNIPADGHWPDKVQVDGRRLRTISESFQGDESVVLIATADELCVLCCSSQVNLNRLDPGNSAGIKQRELPTPQNHNGPVEVPPDPVGKRVVLDDTWLFSARIPMPRHRKPEE